MEKIDQMLNETIEKEIRNLSNLENGSQEKSSAVNDLTKLYELHLESVKIEQAKNDETIRNKQGKSQMLIEIGKVVVPAVISVGGWIAYGHWFKTGLNFEREGVIGSSTFRNLFSKMVPRIKI